jgi:PAS domain-containing protein
MAFFNSDRRAFLYEARVRRADGEYRWMLHYKIGLRDEHGDIVKWYGSSIDIEDRKRAKERLRKEAQELQRSEFYLAEAQRLGCIGSWVFDPARGFDYWSRELFHIYGLDPAQGPPSSEEYLALVHPQDRESMASAMKRMLVEASGFDVTKRIVRPNDEIRHIRCVGTPINDNGALKRIGVGIDVTKHELLTQELRRRGAYLTEAQRLSHTGSFGWKPESGEIVWSDETYRIFEYYHAVQPTIGSVVQRVHLDDRADFLQVLDNASGGTTGRGLILRRSNEHRRSCGKARSDGGMYLKTTRRCTLW